MFLPWILELWWDTQPETPVLQYKNINLYLLFSKFRLSTDGKLQKNELLKSIQKIFDQFGQVQVGGKSTDIPNSKKVLDGTQYNYIPFNFKP